MLLPHQTRSERVRFYVKSSRGAYLDSDTTHNQEDAEKEMAKEFWSGREPCVVKLTTIEEVVVRGE